jgi:hypothetical protein
MAQLKLFVAETEDADLYAEGDVWVQNAADDAAPVVSDVLARPDAGSRFVLLPGLYTYRFNVEDGKGKFTIEIDVDGKPPQKLIAREYDTADAFRGRTLRFQVK